LRRGDELVQVRLGLVDVLLDVELHCFCGSPFVDTFARVCGWIEADQSFSHTVENVLIHFATAYHRCQNAFVRQPPHFHRIFDFRTFSTDHVTSIVVSDRHDTLIHVVRQTLVQAHLLMRVVPAFFKR
jgi:hypothetical protein